MRAGDNSAQKWQLQKGNFKEKTKEQGSLIASRVLEQRGKSVDEYEDRLLEENHDECGLKLAEAQLQQAETTCDLLEKYLWLVISTAIYINYSKTLIAEETAKEVKRFDLWCAKMVSEDSAHKEKVEKRQKEEDKETTNDLYI